MKIWSNQQDLYYLVKTKINSIKSTLWKNHYIFSLFDCTASSHTLTPPPLKFYLHGPSRAKMCNFLLKNFIRFLYTCMHNIFHSPWAKFKLVVHTSVRYFRCFLLMTHLPPPPPCYLTILIYELFCVFPGVIPPPHKLILDCVFIYSSHFQQQYKWSTIFLHFPTYTFICISCVDKLWKINWFILCNLFVLIYRCNLIELSLKK